MAETELGEYLAAQQKVQEGQQGDFLVGSLITDYWQINNKIGVEFTVGVKQRWIGSAFYVVGLGEAGSRNGWVSSTGAGNYVLGAGEGMSAWGFWASGGG